MAQLRHLGIVASRSPASMRGSTRSNVVAWENIPQAGMPSTGRPRQRATQSRLPGWAGAAVALHAGRRAG